MPSTYPEPHTPKPTTTIATPTTDQHIRALTLHFFALLNRGGPLAGDPFLHTALAADFRMTCEVSQGPNTTSTSRAQFLANYAALLRANPGYSFAPAECTVRLSDGDRRAHVLVSGETCLRAREAKGAAEGESEGEGEMVRMQVVNLVAWERRKAEGWVCVRCRCIRGLA